MDFKFSKPNFSLSGRAAVERGLGKPVVQRDFQGLPEKPEQQRSYRALSPHETPSLLTESTKDTTFEIEYTMLKVTELSNTVSKLKAQIDEELGRGRGRDAQIDSLLKYAAKMQLWCNEQKKVEARQDDASTAEAQQALDRAISDQAGLQERLRCLEESVNAKDARLCSKIESLDVVLRSHEKLDDRFLQIESKMRRLYDDIKAGERSISLLQEQSRQLVNRIRLSSVTDQMAALHMFKMTPDMRLDVMNKLAATMDRYVRTLQEAVEKKGLDGSILCGMKATAWQADFTCDADGSASTSQAKRTSPSPVKRGATQNAVAAASSPVKKPQTTTQKTMNYIFTT